jgi:hypothetical protein
MPGVAAGSSESAPDQPRQRRVRASIDCAAAAQRVHAVRRPAARCSSRRSTNRPGLAGDREFQHRGALVGIGAGRRLVRWIACGQQRDLGLQPHRARSRAIARWPLCTGIERPAVADPQRAVGSRCQQAHRARFGDRQQQPLQLLPGVGGFLAQAHPPLGDPVHACRPRPRMRCQRSGRCRFSARVYTACLESQTRCALHSAARLRARASAATVCSSFTTMPISAGHRLALGAQPGQHARDLRRLPVQRGIGEAEHVEAGRVGDQRRPSSPRPAPMGAPPSRSSSRASLSTSCAAASRLPSTRCASRATASARSRAGRGWRNRRWPIQPIPARADLHRPGDAGVPGTRVIASLHLPPCERDQSPGDHQQDHVRWRRRAQPGDQLGALGPRLAGRQADLDQATAGEQAGGVDRGIQRVPVGIAAFHVVDFALVDALRACGGAHGVGGFQDQQGFAAGDQVGRTQRFAGELRGEAIDVQFHRKGARVIFRRAASGETHQPKT